MAILVTGATGRLGGVLTATLLQRKEKIRAIVRSKASPSIPPDVEQFEWDLSTGPLPALAFDGITKIVHLAGLVGEHPYDQLVRNNATATKNLLTNCPTTIQKIVIASSISVYGEYKAQLVDESFQPKTESPYGESKLISEQFAREFCPRLPIVFLRIGMIYGPGFEEGYFTVFERLQKGKMTILGDGKNRLPFVHAIDVVQAILLSLDANTAPCREYNVVGGETPTQEEVLSLAAEALGVPAPKSHTPLTLAKLGLSLLSLFSKPKFSAENISQLSSDRAYSSKRAREELGFEARVKLADGIKEMAMLYKAKNKEQ